MALAGRATGNSGDHVFMWMCTLSSRLMGSRLQVMVMLMWHVSHPITFACYYDNAGFFFIWVSMMPICTLSCGLPMGNLD